VAAWPAGLAAIFSPHPFRYTASSAAGDTPTVNTRNQA
jgi:hypothetical protein